MKKKLFFLCLSWLIFHATATGQAREVMSFSWDLTTNSYASQSSDLVVWESSIATLKSMKGESNEGVNGTLGGDNGNTNTKFPKGATIQLTPKNNVKLRCVEIYTSDKAHANILGPLIDAALSEEYRIEIGNNEMSVIVSCGYDNPIPGFNFTLADKAVRLTKVTLLYDPIPFSPVMTNVNSCYWSTMYLDYPVSIPDGINAYFATVENDVAYLNNIADVIPANTGVILCSNTEGPFTFSQTANSTTTDVSANRLVGWTSDHSISGQDDTYYALGIRNGQIGFYIPKGTVGDTYPIKANKAYLKLEKIISVKELQFVFDDTPTAVETFGDRTGFSHESYNLQGMKVRDDYKGLIIKDGRKIYRR